MMFKNPIISELYGVLKFKSSILYEFCQEMVLPQFSDEIDTACVVFDSEISDKNVQFLFNEKFWHSLSLNEKLFVFIHETLHILLFHGSRGRSFIKSLDQKDRSHDLLNEAMDICINEIIKREYLPYPNAAFPVLGDMMCDIQNCFGSDAAHIEHKRNFVYYYNELLKRKDRVCVTGFDKHSLNEQDQGLIKEIEKKVEDFLSGKDIDKNKIRETDLIEEHSPKMGGTYSRSSKTSSNEVISVSAPPQKKLEYHLDQFLSSKFGGSLPKPKISRKWYGLNRRSHMVRTDLVLPRLEHTIKQKGKNTIRAYCDVSGSVSRMSRFFMSLLTGLDEEKYDVDLFVFADRVKEAFKQPDGSIKYSNAGRGTSIENVLLHNEQYIPDVKEDVVIVLTDGRYTNIKNNSSDVFDNWYFFMTGASSNAPTFSKKINISSNG